jgi:hypothetical protein
MDKVRYDFLPLSSRRGQELYAVRTTAPDGTVKPLGTVKWFKIRHMNRFGWEATAPDGRHRAVHNERWQAALALAWDGKGVFPAPFVKSRRAEVEAA